MAMKGSPEPRSDRFAAPDPGVYPDWPRAPMLWRSGECGWKDDGAASGTRFSVTLQLELFGPPTVNRPARYASEEYLRWPPRPCC